MQGIWFLITRILSRKEMYDTIQTHRINSHIQLFHSWVTTDHVSKNSKRFRASKTQPLLKRLKAFIVVNLKKHISLKKFWNPQKNYYHPHSVDANIRPMPPLDRYHSLDRCHLSLNWYHSLDRYHSFTWCHHSLEWCHQYSVDATTRPMPPLDQ